LIVSKRQASRRETRGAISSRHPALDSSSSDNYVSGTGAHDKIVQRLSPFGNIWPAVNRYGFIAVERDRR
jgi:hypothetical protein